MVPELHTPRLRLRIITPDDAPFFFALNADPEVLRYTGDEPFASLEEARAFLGAYPQYRDYGRGRMGVELRATGELLGWCGLKYHADNGDTDIGYRLARRYWGNGYATEAARASMEDGFTRLGLRRIVAHVHEGNAASFAVCAKLGLEEMQRYEWGGMQWCKLHGRPAADGWKWRE